MILVVIQIAGFVLLLAAAGAGVVGYFKANVAKSTIELYKNDNEALRARVSTFEADLRDANVKIGALETTNHFLISVITQADAIAKLQGTVERIATKVGA